MDISAQTPTLNMVVTQYKSLVVEDYQRTYSWQREQIDELFLDLIDCTGSSDNHFFGTLILQESDSQTATIVDGQQRLTTVFIIVAALRDELLKLSTQTIAPMNQNQRPTDVIKKAWDFLYPTNDFTVQRFGSSRFLKSLMKDRVIAEPTGREDIPQRDNKFKKVTLDFRKAVRHIRKWVDLDLDEYSDDIAKLHRINILLDTLLNRFIVLRVPTQNLTESLEIFLTLNNRGLPLGPSDLVRGEVMSILGTDKSEVEQVKIHKKVLSDWETIVELVHEPEVFLRHFLVATSATKIQKKKIVKEVMERLADNDLNSKKDKTKELWADLQVKAKVYNQIVNPTMGGDCAFHIELSEGLGKSHRILLISVLSHISNLRDRDELVRLTMILAYRNAMAGLNAQKLEDFFQSQSTIIRLESDHASVQENLKARIKAIEFNFKRFLETDGDSGAIGRGLLFAINRKIAPRAHQFAFSDSKVHVEHIAPQTETAVWASALFGDDESAKEDYDLAICKIGNLTLLEGPLNSEVQQKPFEEKVAAYETAAFNITRDLSEAPSWNSINIDQRTKWAFEMFEILWSADKSQKPVIPFSHWVDQS